MDCFLYDRRDEPDVLERILRSASIRGVNGSDAMLNYTNAGTSGMWIAPYGRWYNVPHVAFDRRNMMIAMTIVLDGRAVAAALRTEIKARC